MKFFKKTSILHAEDRLPNLLFIPLIREIGDAFYQFIKQNQENGNSSAKMNSSENQNGNEKRKEKNSKPETGG